ncbi:MAG: ATP-binding protein [Saprospiraceae bacterium]|nr:ATP-binding protein [Saprospiraceae bacterium]
MKIVFTGPECSGKTTLSQSIASLLKWQWMPETSRNYLEQQNNSYNYDDLEKIARIHVSLEEEYLDKSNNLILDTDLITLAIWSEEKFGKVADWISERIKERKYDLYVLCRPDFPWQHDPQRENPDDRDRLFEIYLHKLRDTNKNFVIVGGNLPARIQKVVKALIIV